MSTTHPEGCGCFACKLPDVTKLRLRQLADEGSARLAIADKALEKINAIRNSIVGYQGFNFSEHAYPLVAALEEAGIKGASYAGNRANLGTLLERNAALEANVARLDEVICRTRDALGARGNELLTCSTPASTPSPAARRAWRFSASDSVPPSRKQRDAMSDPLEALREENEALRRDRDGLRDRVNFEACQQDELRSERDTLREDLERERKVSGLRLDAIDALTVERDALREEIEHARSFVPHFGEPVKPLGLAFNDTFNSLRSMLTLAESRASSLAAALLRTRARGTEQHPCWCNEPITEDEDHFDLCESARLALGSQAKEEEETCPRCETAKVRMRGRAGFPWTCPDCGTVLSPDPSTTPGEVAPRNDPPTHRCKVCGALWWRGVIDNGVQEFPSWSLRSPSCGPCCDNTVMGVQIETLPPPDDGPCPPCMLCGKRRLTRLLERVGGKLQCRDKGTCAPPDPSRAEGK